MSATVYDRQREDEMLGQVDVALQEQACAGFRQVDDAARDLPAIDPHRGLDTTLVAFTCRPAEQTHCHVPKLNLSLLAKDEGFLYVICIEWHSSGAAGLFDRAQPVGPAIDAMEAMDAVIEEHCSKRKR